MSNLHRNRRDKDTRLGLIFVLLLQPIIYALVLMLFIFCGCSSEDDELVYNDIHYTGYISIYAFQDTTIFDTTYVRSIGTPDTAFIYCTPRIIANTYSNTIIDMPDAAQADSLTTSDQPSFPSTK